MAQSVQKSRGELSMKCIESIIAKVHFYKSFWAAIDDIIDFSLLENILVLRINETRFDILVDDIIFRTLRLSNGC